MSLSKCYTSTPETTNTARLARLILGPCTDVLRDILKTEVLPSDLSKKVKEFTDKLPRGQRNPLNKSQSEIIFPKPTEQYSGDYSDLDISLLYMLIRNVSTIPAHYKGWGEIPDPGDRSVAANIERIRLIRNQYYGHSSDLSLSDSEFRQKWRNIRDIVVELERHLGTTTIYQDAVIEIKTCSMDPEQEKKYIDLLGDIRKLHTTVDYLSSNMLIMQRELALHDPRLARKIETTKKMIQKHYEAVGHLFVKTHAFERAKELLDNNGYVVIKGNPGTGKTTIAKMLMKELMDEGESPLQLYKFTDLYENISPGDGIVVFIDNLFGEFSLSSDDVQECKARSDMIKVLIESDIDNKSNRLIFALRNDIYQECIQNECNDDFFMSSLVDLSGKENALLKEEILQLSEKYGLSEYIKDKNLIHKVYGMPLAIGFPQCCKLAKSNEDFKRNVIAFLPNAISFMRDYFKTLLKKRTVKSAVLVYLLLNGGKVEVELIENPRLNLELKRYSLEFVGLQNSYVNDFQDSMFCFEGFLITHDTIENTYKFSHSSIQESLFSVLFYFDSEKIIQMCNPSLLLTLTTCKNPKSTQVHIEQRLFKYVARRIANIIGDRSVIGFSSISSLELWNDSHFHEHVLQSEECTSKFKGCLDTNGDSMVVHFSKVGNKRWVEYLLPNSEKRQRYRSINAACSKNQPSIVNLILSSGVDCDLQTCFNAVQSGNIELLLRVCESVDLRQISYSLHPVWTFIRHSLLQEICFMQQTQLIEQVLEKYPFLVDIKNDQGADALQSAASSGDKHAFNLLLKFGCDPYEKDRDNGHTVLTCACQDGRLNMVKYLIDKYPALLQEHTDIHGDTLLYWAAFSGNIDMFEYILDIFENENILPISSDNKPKEYKSDNTGESILHAACKNGHFDMCKYLLNRYPQLLNVSDNDGYNVLHYTARGGNVDLFLFLLSKGLDVNGTTNIGETVLHICCERGREEMCRYLVNMYPGLISVRDNEGVTVLHSACGGGGVEVVSFLVNKGLDINALSKDGTSILHIACLKGNFEVCEYLVENYPHLLDVKDKSSNSVLHDAACGGNVQIVKLLIEKKMNVNKIQGDGETILRQCCRSGKKEMCKYLVNHFSDLLATRDNNGWTVLHSACDGGNVEIVSFLIEKGMDFNALSNEGETILHVACLNGKFEVCEYLIKNYPHLLDVKDKSSNTVLHDAAWGGNVQIVKLLIEKKMDINALQGGGETILHQCCRSGKMEMCEYLVNNFPDLLEIRDNNGWTALHIACRGGSVKIVSFLIEKGIDFNALSNHGKAFLHIACLNGKFEVCEYLAENYPHLLDVTDKFSNSVLHDAAWGGNVQIVKLLIEKKMNINTLQGGGETVLHQCCRSGKIEMCEYLVNHYPDLLEISDNNGWTALHSACWGESVDIVSFLIEKGMDVNTLSNDGKNILHRACLNGNFKVCEYLVENYPHLLDVKDKSSNTVLHDAAWEGNVQIVKLLIEKNMDINALQEGGETVLHLCCRSCKIEMCEYLVNHYPDLLEIRDNNGWTALHSACKKGSVETVSFLIEKGMDIDTLSNDGKSILHIACLYGKFEVCEYLVENYPHLLYVIDKCRNTVLHDAAWGGNVQIVKLLIEKKMDIYSVQGVGETILHQCCRSGKMEMCEYLVNHFPDLLAIRDTQGWTVLHSAWRGGSFEIVSLLIEKGMDFNALQNDGKTILHIACLNGNFEVCEYLVENFPYLLYVIDKCRNTVLHDAAWGGNVQIVKLLIEKKMDINSLQGGGETILHQCCRSGKMEICEYLVNHFPDLLEIRDNDGWTALHIACRGGSVKIVSFLIEKGIYFNALSNHGKAILHIACLNRKFEVCEYLAENYPHLLDVKDKFSNTMLHDAAWGGNVQIVKLLIEKKMNINTLQGGGETVLHQCCRSCQIEMCEHLVNHYPELLEIRDNNGWTALHSACWGGSENIVSFLIEKGMDVNTLSNDGKNILHRACLNGNFKVCEYLVENYPHLLDVKDKSSNTVLHDAAWEGNVQIVKLLIERNTDINALQEGGETVLHQCCRSGKIEMCEYLVNHYPDLLEIRDNNGWTALHSACKEGSVETVSFLIEKELDIYTLSNDGKSILHRACLNGKFEVCEYLVENYPHLLYVIDKCRNTVLHDAAWGGNVQIVKLLIEKKMDIYSVQGGGETILHQCCRSGKMEMCEHLVNHFPELLEIRDNRGWTVLHSACYGGSVEIVSFLIEKGMDFNALSNNGKTILHIACLNGKFEVCEYLVENYPHLLDVNDKSSETVLHDAAWEGNVQIVKLLIEKNMDINALQEGGETVLHQCCRSCKIEMCEYLVNHFPDLLEIRDNNGWTALHSACKEGSVETVSFLIEKELDIYTLSNDGKSILHRACLNGNFEVCEYLVENYPHLLYVTDKCRNTVLHDAAWGGNVQIVKLLIEKKMDIYSVQGGGETILHQCCRSGKMEMCEHLVNHFPELLEIRDNRGWTVLHSACYGGSVEIVSFLIEKGMDFNALSNNGKTILHIACLNGKFEVCEYLVENYPHLLDVNDKSSETVLHDAAREGNVQIVKLLIQKKMDINSLQGDGETILHQCCRFGKMEMCEHLVDNFPDLLAIRDTEGWTVLHSACYGGNIKILIFLINKGMDINILSNNGKSILHIACLNGKFEICEYLVENFPHLLNVKDKSSSTVLHDAAWGGNVQILKLLIEKKMDINALQRGGNNCETILYKCCRSGKKEMCEYLVNHLPELLEIRDNRGWTVLHSACGGGIVEIVSFLIEKGMKINTLSNNGKSILHRACLNGKFEVFEYLIKNYLHLLDVKDKSSNTVLHDAAWGGNVQIVKLLIEKKMDINALQGGGETILHLCCRSGKMEMCEHLVNHFPELLEIKDTEGWTVLHSACYGGSVEIVSFLLNKGLDTNALSNDGKSILHRACLNGKFEVCKYLVKNYPQLLDARDKCSNTVLHDAVREGNVQIVRLLIEKKMNIFSRQEDGETILHQCCRSGKIEMCEYLVNHFSELIKIRDNRGWTVLHSACSGGSVDIVSFLLNKGLDINALSNVGESILHIACLNGKHDVCRFLSTNHQDLLAVKDNRGKSVIDIAAEHGDIDLIHILRERR